MNRAAFPYGKSGPTPAGRRPWLREERGFTLIEMCIVLLIIALLFGLSMPAMRSAFTEQAVRRDSHQLALMVKTAMIQSSEQHRAYVIDLTGKSMALHPLEQVAVESDADFGFTNTPPPMDSSSAADASAGAASNTLNNAPPIDVSVTTDLDEPNKLMTPDPKKADSWIDMPDNSQWVFQPGELCPATHVRIERGDSYIELTFNALTGNVDQEANSIQ